MCGRYYVDDETAKEIEKIVRSVDEQLKREAKDIHPTESAPVLVSSESGIKCEYYKWGFPGIMDKSLVINARSESAIEKKMFSEAVEHRRIVIPAAGFYEWNKHKEKSTFTRRDSKVLYMAGVYSRYDDGNRFVILTTAANESMKPVHDRMPLILDKDDIVPWLTERSKTEAFLAKVPCQLERTTEFEQMTLF
ncbi:MAG: SOS response-associated peptidase [Lachnospiraceae bacterium]|nr:SOS response-associated peptidase [Lachnospiraceae bacterium]MBP3595228.1 SOS response-associated peptidase [Lachnospiraceae bacterium]